MQSLQLPLRKLKIDDQEFLDWLGRIPEPERHRHSPDFLATLFIVKKAIEAEV